MELRRLTRYYYLKFLRLKGQPHELALGIALGVFSGMLPILPFQTAFAVALAFPFRASKITAAIGTWVSNPFNWYFLYYYSYKLGAHLLGLKEQKAAFSAIMHAIRAGEEGMVIAGKILGAGSGFVGSFLLGGFVMGIVAGPVSYYIFLPFFRSAKSWRKRRKERKEAAASADQGVR